jgi:hypothetical protein
VITPEARKQIDNSIGGQELTLVLQWNSHVDLPFGFEQLSREERTRVFAEKMDARKFPLLNFLKTKGVSVVDLGGGQASATATPEQWGAVADRLDLDADVRVVPNATFESF